MFGSIEDWREYAMARGQLSPSDASDEEAKAALTRGSDYVRLRYVANLLPGYDSSLKPFGFDYPLVEEASYVAAGFELDNPGFFSSTYTPAQQKVLSQVGNIRWTVTGDSESTYGAMPVSTFIEALFELYILHRDRPPVFLRAIGA